MIFKKFSFTLPHTRVSDLMLCSWREREANPKLETMQLKKKVF
jgi:hypothetical protein